MKNIDFDWKAIEELHKAGKATLENIEAITGKLIANDELKTRQDDGDLITIMRTNTREGQQVVQYERRTHRNSTEEPNAEADKYYFSIVID